MNLRPTIGDPRAASDDTDVEDLVDLVGARRHIDVVIPRTQITAKMRLCSRREISEARAEARRALQAEGFPVDASAVAALGAGEEWQYELAVRTLAVAIRNPKKTELALASLDDWRECDDDQIAALMKTYDDFAARIDPLGENAPGLTEPEVHALIAAAKKKDADTLMSFGSRKLASFILTSAFPPASSPTPTS
jgi:hypothetical protein